MSGDGFQPTTGGGEVAIDKTPNPSATTTNSFNGTPVRFNVQMLDGGIRTEIEALGDVDSIPVSGGSLEDVIEETGSLFRGIRLGPHEKIPQREIRYRITISTDITGRVEEFVNSYINSLGEQLGLGQLSGVTPQGQIRSVLNAAGINVPDIAQKIRSSVSPLPNLTISQANPGPDISSAAFERATIPYHPDLGNPIDNIREQFGEIPTVRVKANFDRQGVLQRVGDTLDPTPPELVAEVPITGFIEFVSIADIGCGQLYGNIEDELANIESNSVTQVRKLEAWKKGLQKYLEALPGGVRVSSFGDLPTLDGNIQPTSVPVNIEGEQQQRVFAQGAAIPQRGRTVDITQIDPNSINIEDLRTRVNSFNDIVSNLGIRNCRGKYSRGLDSIESRLSRAEDLLNQVKSLRDQLKNRVGIGEALQCAQQFAGTFDQYNQFKADAQNLLDRANSLQELKIGGVNADIQTGSELRQRITELQTKLPSLEERRAKLSNPREVLAQNIKQGGDGQTTLPGTDATIGVSPVRQVDEVNPSLLPDECVNSLQKKYNSADKKIDRIKKILNKLEQQSKDIRDKIPCSDAFPNIASQLNRERSTIQQISNGTGDFKQSPEEILNSIKSAQNKLPAGIRRGSEQITQKKDGVRNIRDSIKGVTETLKEMQSRLNSSQKNIEDFQSGIEGMIKFIESGGKSGKQFGQANASNDETNLSCLRNYNSQFNDLISTIESESETISKALQIKEKFDSRVANLLKVDSSNKCLAQAPSSIRTGLNSARDDLSNFRNTDLSSIDPRSVERALTEAKSVKNKIEQSKQLSGICRQILSQRADTVINGIKGIRESLPEQIQSCIEVFPKVDAKVNTFQQDVSGINGDIDDLLSTTDKIISQLRQGSPPSVESVRSLDGSIQNLQKRRKQKLQEIKEFRGVLQTKINEIEQKGVTTNLQGDQLNQDDEQIKSCLSGFDSTLGNAVSRLENSQEEIDEIKSKVENLKSSLGIRGDTGDISGCSFRPVTSVREDVESLRKASPSEVNRRAFLRAIDEANQTLTDIKESQSLSSRCKNILSSRVKTFISELNALQSEKAQPQTCSGKYPQVEQSITEYENAVFNIGGRLTQDQRNQFLRQASQIRKSISGTIPVDDPCRGEFIDRIETATSRLQEVQAQTRVVTDVQQKTDKQRDKFVKQLRKSLEGIEAGEKKLFDGNNEEGS